MAGILQMIVVLAAANIAAGEPCTRNLDLILGVDASATICHGSNNPCPEWNAVLDFCKAMVDTLTIGKHNSRVALFTFGNETNLEFGLNSYSDKASLQSAIGNVKFLGGELGDLLAVAKLVTQVNNVLDGGDRLTVFNVLVLITDGAPKHPEELYAVVSKSAQVVGTVVFIVCVTPGCTENCAIGVSSPPHKPNETYFLVDNYLSLNQIANGLMKKICAYKVLGIFPVK